jgi:hypothetical protein
LPALYPANAGYRCSASFQHQRSGILDHLRSRMMTTETIRVIPAYAAITGKADSALP